MPAVYPKGPGPAPLLSGPVGSAEGGRSGVPAMYPLLAPLPTCDVLSGLISGPRSSCELESLCLGAELVFELAAAGEEASTGAGTMARQTRSRCNQILSQSPLHPNPAPGVWYCAHAKASCEDAIADDH